MAKEFCSCAYIFFFLCPCRLQHHFLNLISVKQSCPIVLASHNWLQLGFLLHTCLCLSCFMPRRENIYLRCTLAYRSGTPQNNPWRPFIRLDTWDRAAAETPSSIRDPTPLLSAGTRAFVSEEPSRSRCFLFWMVAAWGSGAFCFTNWLPLRFCKPEFSLE